MLLSSLWKRLPGTSPQELPALRLWQMAAIAGDADQVLKAVAKILASASSTGKHRSTSKKVQRVSTNNVPPSHSRVGKQLKFLVHIAMSSAYLIFIYESQKHHDRGSHWEERMVEANEEKKREKK